MNLKEVRDLIEIVASRPTIEEFEFERSGVRIRIRQSAQAGAASAEVPRGAVTAGQPLPPASESPGSGERPAPASGLYEITSPMVGTFYRAPSPDSDPFVKVGDFIEKGSVVCIIEAMKLMNEIESEVAGEVVSIRLENGDPVEYGQVLIELRPR
jgi:oxaloacetate decarboxylase alpha subunit